MTFQPAWTVCFPGLLLPSESSLSQSVRDIYALLASVWLAPLLNTLSKEAGVQHGEQKVLSNNGFRMANCFCCLPQNVMVCLAYCRQELQQKSWKTASFNLTETKTKCSRPRLSFLSSRRLETRPPVSRTTSLDWRSLLQWRRYLCGYGLKSPRFCPSSPDFSSCEQLIGLNAINWIESNTVVYRHNILIAISWFFSDLIFGRSQ